MVNKNVKTSFTADTKSLETGIKRMESLMSKMNDTMGKMSTSSERASEKMTSSTKKSTDSVDKMSDSFRSTESVVKRFQKQAEGVGSMPRMTESQRALVNFKKGMDTAGTSTESLDKGLKVVGNMPKMEPNITLMGRFINGLNGIETEAGSTGTGVGRLGTVVEKLGTGFKKLPETSMVAMGRVGDHFQKVAQVVGKVSITMVNSFNSGLKKMETQALKSSTKIAESYAKNIGNGLKKALKTVSAGALAGEIYSVKMAADTEVMEAQFGQAFQGAEKTATDMLTGMSGEWNVFERRIKPGMAQLQSYFKGTGLGEGAMDATERALTIAADAAAFMDVPIEDAIASLKSGLMGNFESLDMNLGVNMNKTKLSEWVESTKGKEYDDLADAEQQQMILAYIENIQKLSEHTGQATRESTQFSNVTENLKSSIQTLGSAIGETQIPWLSTQINDLSHGILGLSDKVQEFTGKLAGFDTFKEKMDYISGVIEPLKPALAFLGTVAISPALVGGLGLMTSGLTGLQAITSSAKFKGMFSGIKLDGKIPTFLKDAVGGSVTGLMDKMGVFGDVLKKVGTVGGTSIGAIGKIGMTAVTGMGTALTSLVGIALASLAPTAIIGIVLAGLGVLNSEFGTQIDQIISTVTEKGPQVVGNFIEGILARLPELINSGAMMVTKILGAITANLPAVIQGGLQILQSLVSGVAGNLGILIPAVVQVVGTLANEILSALPGLVLLGMELLASLAQGLVDNMPLIMSTVSTILGGFVGKVVENLPLIIESGISVLMSLAEGIAQALPSILAMGMEILPALIMGIFTNLPTLVIGALDIVMTLVNTILENLPAVMRLGMELLFSIVDGIVAALPEVLVAVLMFVFTFHTAVAEALPDILLLGVELIWTLIKGMLQAIGTFFVNVYEALKGVWNKLRGVADEEGKETNKVVDENSKAMSSGMVSDTSTMSTGVASNFGSMRGGVTSEMSTMSTNSLYYSGQMRQGTTSDFQLASASAQGITGELNTGVTSNMSAMSGNALMYSGQASTGTVGDFQGMRSGVDTELGAMHGNVTGTFADMNKEATASGSGLAGSTATNWSEATKQQRHYINMMTSDAKTFSGNIGRVMSGAFRGLVVAVSNGMVSARNVLKGQIQGMVRDLGWLHNGFYNAGSYAMVGLQMGLLSGRGSVMATANGIANSVAMTVRRALRIHSPSRVMEGLGSYTGEGFNQGLSSWMGTIGKTAGQYADAVVNGAEMSKMAEAYVGDVMRTQMDLSGMVNNQVTGAVQLKENDTTSQISVGLNLSMGGTDWHYFVEDVTDEQNAVLRRGRY